MARSCSLAFLVYLALPALVPAAEPFRYIEGTHGPAELRYINGLPVLSVAGTPEEIGAQIGALTGPELKRLVKYPHDMVNRLGLGVIMSPLIKISNSMWPQFPPDYRRELDALVKQTGLDHDQAVLGNTVFDILKIAGCSTFVVEPARSATGGPLFGRNLDYPTLGFLHHYSLVTVYRPESKHAFVSVGFPGMIGCISGMNDAGLAVATLEVYSARDGSPRFDAKGMPYALCYRRLLEECTTVAEAERLLRSMKRTTMNNLTVCDRNGGAVFEFTPNSLAVRGPQDGVCACTNHFRTEALAIARPEKCRRYAILVAGNSPAPSADGQPAGPAKLDQKDVARKLNAVHQGNETLQTMIFEPATLKLHLAIGRTPSSALPMKTLDLTPFFKQK
jgi:isopenicillin-N N-acyltransferase like protein